MHDPITAELLRNAPLGSIIFKADGRPEVWASKCDNDDLPWRIVGAEHTAWRADDYAAATAPAGAWLHVPEPLRPAFVPETSGDQPRFRVGHVHRRAVVVDRERGMYYKPLANTAEVLARDLNADHRTAEHIGTWHTHRDLVADPDYRSTPLPSAFVAEVATEPAPRYIVADVDGVPHVVDTIDREYLDPAYLTSPTPEAAAESLNATEVLDLNKTPGAWHPLDMRSEPGYPEPEPGEVDAIEAEDAGRVERPSLAERNSASRARRVREVALAHAVAIAQAGHLDGSVVKWARDFEAYLNGEQTEAADRG